MAGRAEPIRPPRRGDHHVDRRVVERSPDDTSVAEGTDLALQFEGHGQSRADKAQRCVDAPRRRLVGGVGTESAGPQSAEETVELARVSAAGEGGDGTTIEVRCGERRARGERIGSSYGDTDAFPGDFDGGHTRIVDLAAQQGDVDVGPVERSGGREPGGKGPGDNNDIGQLPAPLGQEAGKEIGGKCGNRPETDLTGFTGADPRHALADPVVTGEEVPCLAEQDLPGGRECHPPAGAVEEHDTELGLKASNELAHGGLGDVEPTGRIAEVQLLCHGEEGPQVS